MNAKELVTALNAEVKKLAMTKEIIPALKKFIHRIDISFK
jgi:hypothetical protein